MKKRSKIVIENELFYNSDFSSNFAPFWEVLGEVLVGFWDPRGSQGRPRGFQEAPKRLPRRPKRLPRAPRG